MGGTTLPLAAPSTSPLRRHISMEFPAADSARDIYLCTLNPAMSRVIRAVHEAAMGPQTVLLTGEPGVGKRTLARQIHQWSRLRRYPLIMVDCAALSSDALAAVSLDQIVPHYASGESETPATIFFHDLAELSVPGQRRVVEFIEEMELPARGDNAAGSVRLIASATGAISPNFSRDLLSLVGEVQVEIPPLRQRPEDILPLAEHMLCCAARNRAMLPMRLAADAMAALALHTWPGNLRELRDTIERAAVLARSAPAVTVRHLPRTLGLTKPGEAPDTGSPQLTSLEEMERLYIAQVLAETPSFEKAAATLGIHPSTLWRKRRRYKLMNTPGR